MTAYESAGVDYDTLDGAKRLAIELAAATLSNPLDRGAVVESRSLGEPATLLRIGDITLAVVLECLGTKSMIAREVEDIGIDAWEAVGVDAVAAIVNDLCCVGALPLAVNAYFATGSAAWYAGSRHASLMAGWARAVTETGAAWLGGESPTLSGLIDPEQIDIAGSALGSVPAGHEPWLGANLQVGDDIVFVASSGLHANGASLARVIARTSPSGWATALPSGRTLGTAVLDATVLYPRLVQTIFDAGLPVHYASHITGHGLRKVMRADRQLTYRITALPEVPEVLAFMAADLEAGEAYATLNMGVGMALYVAAGAGESVAVAASHAGYSAFVAGRVESGPRQVVLEPLGVTYGSGELALR